MKYFDENLQKLKEYRKNLYDSLQKILEEEKYDFSKFELEDTRDGQKTIQIDYNGEKIRLNSLYSPKREADRWVKQFNFDNMNVSVLMFGIANGIFAEAIMDKMKEDAIAILMEPDISLFIYCLKNFDMTRIISAASVKIYVDKLNDEKFYFDLHRYINAVMLPTQIICFYPEMEKIYYEKAKKFEAAIKEKYSFEMTVTFNLEQVYRKGIENSIENLHFIKNSNYVTEFIGKIPEGVPVIIVSAGPSLDKNVDELKMAKGKAFILVTDTAVKTLLKHGVEYDAIITIDVNKADRHLNDERCFKSPMIASLKSKNSILEMNKGRKIWLVISDFMCELYHKYRLKFPNWLLGGSVATDAFMVAKTVGAKTIVFVGQDLAYLGEASHADGVVQTFKEESIYVEGIYGNKVKTRSDWLSYIYWFNSAIAELDDSIQVIDATEGGAKIEGTQIMNLSEVIDMYCKSEFDFCSLLDEMSPTFSDEKYEIFKKDMYNIINELKKIKERAENGIIIAEDILKAIKEKKRDTIVEKEAVKEIKDINKYVQQQLVYSLIWEYVESKIQGIMGVNCFTGDSDKDAAKSFELSKEAFKSIIDVVDFTIPLLEKAVEEI